MRPSVIATFWITLLFSWSELSAQQSPDVSGYTVDENRIIVKGLDHWRFWETPEGVGVIDEDGNAHPRFLRRDINAVANAVSFMNVAGADTTTGGISSVGFGHRSADKTLPFIIDGDMTTYWEPDIEQSLENLWVEIDLGRAVIARRITVHFVDQNLGDPFLKFRILTSDGRQDFGREKKRQFVRAGQVTFPNQTQRRFKFELQPIGNVPEDLEGRVVQFVRIDLLDTKGSRAQEVTEHQFSRLQPGDRGTIEYFRVTHSGREIPVIRESYQQLDQKQRGPVRYYRRERPRLAEIDVETLGDNIVTLTQRSLFEKGDFFEGIARRFVTDGLQTAFGIRLYDRIRNEHQVVVELGAKFWLDRIRLLSPESPPTSYEIRVTDGSLDVSGDFVWHSFDERTNAQQFLQLEERFPQREVQLIELRRLDLIDEGQSPGLVSEIQAYGEGFVSEMVMTSPLIKLGPRQIVSQLHWEGEQPPGTKLEIRTRSGDELISEVHYFRRDGREVSEGLYERLPARDQGQVEIQELPGPDWSTWSDPYPFSGSAYLSPTPRRVTLVQIALSSTQPLRSASIKNLSMNLRSPLVDRVVGEVTPTRAVKPGVMQSFSMYVRPFPTTNDPGFDRLFLRSSATAPLSMEGIRKGTASDLAFGTAITLWEPGLESTVTIQKTEGLELHFSEPVRSDSVLEFLFRTEIFEPSTSFTVELSHSEVSGIRQTIDAGDANQFLSSNSLVVISDLNNLSLFDELHLTPGLFTPNSDGINDELFIRFKAFQITGNETINVGIFDLSGYRMRDLSFRPAALSGEHQITWDGRNNDNKLLPPGMYLVHVSIPTQAVGKLSQTKTVSLAY